MNIDFSKYQKLINSFRGEANKPSFDIKFNQSTANMAKTEKFLLKMELKRLASACTRSIDLRGLVDGDCKLYEYSGQSHFLDDVAIKVFEENIEQYKGYTFGVYDAVKNTENNFRVIYQKEQNKNSQLSEAMTTTSSQKKSADKIQYPVRIFSLNQSIDRIEERMNYVTPLTIVLDDNQRKTVSSIDISISGLKFRLNSQTPLHIEQLIKVTFNELHHNFQFKKDHALIYQVKNIQSDTNTQLVGCQRIEAEGEDAFKAFLFSYIQANKRRYKINLENTISTLQARTFEHYVLPKLNELPIFFQHKNKAILPRYALTTNNNQSTFQYWQDEESHSNLQFLVNEERLARLLKKTRQGKPLLVYSFIHQHQGKDFFYTLDEDQVDADDGFFATFLTFAANKSSFAITQLSYFPVEPSKAYLPFALANSQELTKQYINLPPSASVIDTITALDFAVVACDITHSTAVEQYKNFSTQAIDRNRLKQFGHKRSKEKITVDELGLTYKNQRQTPRYLYNTPTTLECNNTQWQGKTIDFSISGLKVELDSSADVCAGDIVNITFPALQKITSTHDLRLIPYEVIRTNKKQNVINLRGYVKDHQHVGRSFFKVLIDKNKDKLITDDYSLLIPGLAEALRTHYAQSMQIPALIVQTSGSRYKIEVLVSNNEADEFLQCLHKLSDRKSFYNFYPIISKLYKDNYLESCLKKLIINQEPIAQVLYISISNKVVQTDSPINVRFESELPTSGIRKAFIKKSIEKGHFFAIALNISRTKEPNIEYLNAELSYISTYAIHRSKQLEQEIWSVVAAIQYVDITHEVVFSHGL